MNSQINLELDDILFHLQYAHKGLKYLEENGLGMKTVNENLAYLIDDVQTKIRDLEKTSDKNI